MNRKRRLLHIVAATGLLPTRQAAEEAIRKCRVTVDGLPQRNPHYQIDIAKRTVSIDGVVIKEPTKKRYFMLNKPAGITCEKGEASNAYMLLRRLKLPIEEERTFYCVGRLDKDTTGLLIFTNDGDLAHRLLRPEQKVPKTYSVKAKNIVTDEEFARLRHGVEIHLDERTYLTKPCTIANISNDGVDTTFLITLQEGKKRQIRKMLEAVKHPVIELRRLRVGNLRLGDLPSGHFKEISKEDILGKQRPAKPAKSKAYKDDYFE